MVGGLWYTINECWGKNRNGWIWDSDKGWSGKWSERLREKEKNISSQPGTRLDEVEETMHEF